MTNNNQISGTQIRAARALLDITLFDLEQFTGINERTLRRYEAQEGVPPDRGGNLAKVRLTLEGMGVEFVSAPDDARGVILHKIDR
ncbi:transcriptional regulator [Alphaproteobacteria bacterium]|nr:transcriptional regulator [Alphaproteobacteria bacterium]